MVWALFAFEMFLSGSDPATSGLDAAAGYVVTALFLCPSIDRVWSGAKSRTGACTCLPAGSCRPVHRDDTSVRLITSLKGSRAEDNDPWLFAARLRSPSLGLSLHDGHVHFGVAFHEAGNAPIRLLLGFFEKLPAEKRPKEQD